MHDDFVDAGPLHDFSLSELGHFMVVIVPLEELLGRIAPQGLMVILERVVFQVAPLLIDVLLVKVVLLRRNKRCLQALMG